MTRGCIFLQYYLPGTKVHSLTVLEQIPFLFSLLCIHHDFWIHITGIAFTEAKQIRSKWPHKQISFYYLAGQTFRNSIVGNTGVPFHQQEMQKSIVHYVYQNMLGSSIGAQLKKVSDSSGHLSSQQPPFNSECFYFWTIYMEQADIMVFLLLPMFLKVINADVSLLYKCIDPKQQTEISCICEPCLM